MKQRVIAVVASMAVSAVITLVLGKDLSFFGDVLSGCGFLICAFSCYRGRSVWYEKIDSFRTNWNIDIGMIMTGTVILCIGIVISMFA